MQVTGWKGPVTGELCQIFNVYMKSKDDKSPNHIIPLEGSMVN